MSDKLYSAAGQPADSAHRMLVASELPPHSYQLAQLLATDPAPEVRRAAAQRCADLASLASAWQTESDPGVRTALANALGSVLAETEDASTATAWLVAEHCTDGIRSDVARLTRDSERCRVAIASIRDESALRRLALSDEPDIRHAATERLQSLTQAREHDGGGEPPTPAVPGAEVVAERASRYVPRILQQHLVADPSGRWWIAEGTAVFVDISGFTKLSERLARKGREGAEQITEVIGRSFESILEVAYDSGGSLLKFGGDALLLWFEGEQHAARACRATVSMRRVLRRVGRIELPGANVTLRMSQGVHSGAFHFFAVGKSHTELLTAGPAWSRLAAMEQAAEGGEIVVSSETAALLSSRCIGAAKGAGRMLAREPGELVKLPLIPRPKMPAELLARCLSPAIREHLLAGGGGSEHRPVTIAFIHFEGTDAMIEQRGPAATANALHRLVSAVQAATEEQRVSFLASDVDADGGKLILTAGAPKVTGDDEERMLLALRKIVSAELPIAVRIGVHRGSVFAGDIGPAYRRTYTVMGDAVNLSARLMAKAVAGAIYATADVLNQSNTLFQTVELEPFLVKGKAHPIRAWSVGRAIGSRARQVSLQRLPLIGRDAELTRLREALAAARSGTGRLVEVVGEAGLGKSRLLEAMRDEAGDFTLLHAVCEAYTASAPYSVWRELLREYVGFNRDATDETVAQGIRELVLAKCPDLAPWLPLIAIAFDVAMPPTPEVDVLAKKNRRSKMHEAVAGFLQMTMQGPHLIELENAHHMDAASAELLAYLVRELPQRPWLFGVARRTQSGGFAAPDAPSVSTLQLEPLASKDALRITQLATEDHPLPLHLLEVVAQRSGGNPQFLHDLLRSAIASGGVGALPDSAEAAAMARIDALTPADRDVVRRAAVFGMTFHPRMLAWFSSDVELAAPTDATWGRLQELFEDEPDGYLRFRRSHLRDAAYEGLPYKVRRRLHGVVAKRLAEETDELDEAASILSLHWYEAGDYGQAWRYAAMAGKRARGMYAYVEAAELYARALDAGRRLAEVEAREFATMYEAQADCWYRAAEFHKASEGYASALRLRIGDQLAESKLLLMRSLVEHKLGNYTRALRWAARARKAVGGFDEPAGLQQAAQTTSWYAVVLQAEGRTKDALRWAQRALSEAEAAGDTEATGEAYAVMGWAFMMLGREGANALFQRSLEAYERCGNLERQAGLLSDLGVVCQSEGRWDEALSYYERGREEAQRIGNTIQAALARINISEILIDRGDYAQADELLLETLPLWKAAQHRYFLGVCLFLLGRSALRAGRFDDALKRLAESKANFESIGAEEDVPSVEAALAECRLYSGDADAALELTGSMLSRAGSSNGVARVESQLKRVRALALLQRGDEAGARGELEASLAAARTRHDLFEILRTSLALIELDRSQRREPDAATVFEANDLLERLRVRRLPVASRAVEESTA